MVDILYEKTCILPFGVLKSLSRVWDYMNGDTGFLLE